MRASRRDGRALVDGSHSEFVTRMVLGLGGTTSGVDADLIRSHHRHGRSDEYGLVASVAHLHSGVPAGGESAKFYGDPNDPTRLLIFVDDHDIEVSDYVEDTNMGKNLNCEELTCSYSAPEERRVYLYLNPPLEFDSKVGEMRIAGGYAKEQVGELAAELRELLSKMMNEAPIRSCDLDG